jgi:biotin-(acetyl-CoA carboxylase) ligase
VLIWAAAMAEVLGLLLKWPNDLVDPAGRKVGGMLAELDGVGADRVPSVILGVGINIEPPEDPALILAGSLRGDAEEDLSRVVGDVLAHRIAGAGRTLLASGQDNAWRAAQSLSEYWLYEQPLLSSRAALQAFTQSLQQVQTRTSLLEQRLRRLEERRPYST